MGSRRAATWRTGDCDCPRRGIVWPQSLGGGSGIVGAVRKVVAGARCVICVGGFCCCGRVLEALRARVCDDDRGGTLPGGMLYMLVMLLLSAGLGGDGDLVVRPRFPDRTPLLSMLFFRSGSLFSPLRVSMLGRRLDATDGFRESSAREALRECASDMSFRGIVSAKLGSVSSRMSDRGRILAQEDALMDCPRSSPKLLPTITWVLSDPGDVTNEEPLALSNEGQDSHCGPFPGEGCE